MLAGGCNREYVCLGAAADCASGVCCLAGSSEEGSQGAPSGFALGVLAALSSGRMPQGRPVVGHAAEDLLLCGVTLVHPCSLLPGVGKCAYGLLGCA